MAHIKKKKTLKRKRGEISTKIPSDLRIIIWFSSPFLIHILLAFSHDLQTQEYLDRDATPSGNMFAARVNLGMWGWCTALEMELNLSLIPRLSPEGPGMSSQQMERESFTSWKFILSIPRAQTHRKEARGTSRRVFGLSDPWFQTSQLSSLWKESVEFRNV